MSEETGGFLAFLVYFPAMWILVCVLVAHLGGWARLAREYRAQDGFDGQKWRMQSGQVGVSNYGFCLTIGGDQRALYLTVLFIFRIGHPPLLVPWGDVSVTEGRQLLWRYVELRFIRTPEVRVRLSKRVYDQAARAAGRASMIDARPIEPA